VSLHLMLVNDLTCCLQPTLIFLRPIICVLLVTLSVILIMEPVYPEVHSVLSAESKLVVDLVQPLLTKYSHRWNRITMLVRLNEPPNLANGNIQLLCVILWQYLYSRRW
jgi:hypothetical protein